MRPSDMGTWEAPVGPIPEFVSPGTKLIHLPESFVSHEVSPGYHCHTRLYTPPPASLILEDESIRQQPRRALSGFWNY